VSSLYLNNFLYKFCRIIQLLESGIYDYWLSMRMYDPFGEVRARLFQLNVELDWDVLQINKMVGVFIIWCVGIAVSVGAIAAENIYKYLSANKSNDYFQHCFSYYFLVTNVLNNSNMKTILKRVVAFIVNHLLTHLRTAKHIYDSNIIFHN